MCDCKKDLRHWLRYTRLRFIWRMIWYAPDPCMSHDEYEHWFNNKPTPRVIREALKIVEGTTKQKEVKW